MCTHCICCSQWELTLSPLQHDFMWPNTMILFTWQSSECQRVFSHLRYRSVYTDIWLYLHLEGFFIPYCLWHAAAWRQKLASGWIRTQGLRFFCPQLCHLCYLITLIRGHLIIYERSIIRRAVSAIIVVQNFSDFFQLLFKNDDVSSNASDSVTFLKVFVNASHLAGRVAARFALQKKRSFYNKTNFGCHIKRANLC